jgi:NTP pyrophosphatase (non-canonical NTP hydrolase)
MNDMQISEFQRLIEQIYFDRDKARGIGGTFMWFTEEVGELASALRKNNDRDNLEEEFADVLAWLCTLASISGVEMQDVIRKYGDGCPGCHRSPCDCSEKN